MDHCVHIFDNLLRLTLGEETRKSVQRKKIETMTSKVNVEYPGNICHGPQIIVFSIL